MADITFDQWKGDGFCICCNAQLHEIDPDIICMECVDMNCNIDTEKE